MYSDKFGRKAALQLSLIVMAVATAMLGILPTYQQVGSLATIMLVACRLAQVWSSYGWGNGLWPIGLPERLLIAFLQGLSVGGNYSGAMVFLVESAPPGHENLFGSICFASGDETR